MGIFSSRKSNTPENPEAAAQALAAIADEKLDAAASLEAEIADVVERPVIVEEEPDADEDVEPEEAEDDLPVGPVNPDGTLRTYADKLPVTRVVVG